MKTRFEVLVEENGGVFVRENPITIRNNLSGQKWNLNREDAMRLVVQLQAAVFQRYGK